MLTVLVIDDDPHMGLILSRILAKHGFVVRVAIDGPSGLAYARSLNPDLILLDIVMPGMDGVEVAKRLRRDPECASIPIVFLTAFATAIGRHEARAVNAEGFISKPFEVDHLVNTVKTLSGLPNGRGQA